MILRISKKTFLFAIFLIIGTLSTPLCFASGTTYNMGDHGNWNIRFDGPPDGPGSTLTTALSYVSLLIDDLNGDGKKDILVGARRADFNGRIDSGSLYIIYGDLLENLASTGTGTIINLASSTSYNIRIDSATALDEGLRSVTVADFDHNGRKDLILNVYVSDYNGRNNSGSTYVIYDYKLAGYTGTGNTMDMASSTSWNLRYDGPVANSVLTAVRVADLDNDTRDDLVIDAYGANYPGYSFTAGSVYVIYNTLIDDYPTSTTGNIIDLASSTNWNIRYDGGGASTTSTGASVFGDRLGYNDSLVIGDIDGDHKKDLVMPAPTASYNNRWGAGSLYVVKNTLIDDYSPSTTGNVVNLASSTNYNFRFDGTKGKGSGSFFLDSGLLGWFGSVATGDLDGDGKEDIVVAESADRNGRANAGSTYVIYGALMNQYAGTGNNLDLASSTNWSIRYDGAATLDRHGHGGQITIEDLDNDGKKDLALGASGYAVGNESNPGKVYVIFNDRLGAVATSTTGNIADLANTTNWDFRYDGAAAADWLGASAQQFVDVNNDNQKDAVIGAWGADNGGDGTGSLYIIYYFPHSLSLDSGFGNPSTGKYTKSGRVSAPNNPTRIAAVEWSESNDPNGTWNDCDPSDGSFDSNDESFVCTFNGLSSSRTFFFRAEDAKDLYAPSSTYASAFFAAPPTNIAYGLSQGGGGAPSGPITTPYSPATTTTPITTPPPTGTGTAVTPPSVTPPHYLFPRNLRLGDKGEDVRKLQIYLNTHGFVLTPSGPGSPGQETNLFGGFTYRALIKLQEAHASEILQPAGLTKGTGYFGPATRAWVNG